MEQQEEYISSQVQSILTMPVYIDGISRILELLAIVVIIATVIYLFFKVKNVPGRVMMLAGAIGSILSFLVPMFIVLLLGSISSSHFIFISIFEIVGSIFMLLAAIGFIRFAIAMRHKSES